MECIDSGRINCSSLHSVLAAPYNNCRYFPLGDDAVSIVDAEVHRLLGIMDNASAEDRLESQRAALSFVSEALQWLEDAHRAQLLQHDHVSRVLDEWCCTETELERMQ